MSAPTVSEHDVEMARFSRLDRNITRILSQLVQDEISQAQAMLELRLAVDTDGTELHRGTMDLVCPQVRRGASNG